MIKIFKVEPLSHILEEQMVFPNAHKSCIYALCPNPNNGKLYSADGFGTLKLWKFYDKKVPVDHGQIHNGIIHCVCLTKNSLFVFTAGVDMKLKQWIATSDLKLKKDW